jgi:nucleoside-diphosphate-sugar epimerase
MYLVTGGVGFIGSHIVERLLGDGKRVRVLDNVPEERVVAGPVFLKDAEVFHGDVRDPEVVERAMHGIETVFHQAAEASVPRSVADPVGTYEANVTGTLNVLLAARDAGVKRVVFASSSAVYGDSPEMPKVETMLPAPLSPYASSKLAGEDLCKVFTKAYGLEAVALRYFHVYGPRQNPNAAYAAVIPRFLATLSSGEQPVIFGDGEQSRDFVFVDNVVDANLLAATTPGLGGRVYNVASGSAITLNAMLRAMAATLGIAASPQYEPDRAGDVRHSLADISAARTDLGFTPTVSFADGLRRTAESIMGPAMAGVR